MERFFKRIRNSGASSSKQANVSEPMENQSHVELNLDDIISDPGLRKPIEEFDVSIRDQVRREYLLRGPCQPIGHMYPQRTIANHQRSFQDVWFKQFEWLEYSVSKDAAFCFWCYLFKSPHKGGKFGEDVFTKTGFNNWKKRN